MPSECGKCPLNVENAPSWENASTENLEEDFRKFLIKNLTLLTPNHFDPRLSFKKNLLAKICLQCRAGADQTRSVNFCPPCTKKLLGGGPPSPKYK
jgi:hypothetical protein